MVSLVNLLQIDLDETAAVWDCHSIRSVRNQRAYHGRPYIMFTCPELYNTIDYLCAADGVKLECCRQQCLAKTVVPCDDTVFELCCIIMQDSGWDFPYSAREGIDLYINLHREILSLL